MKQENISILSPGECFEFKGFEWIVLDNNVDGGVLAIMSSTWNNERYSFDDDGCNNYAKSSLRRKLLNELLPVLGEDNLIPHEVDMVADNGDDRYGTVTDRVFILSCDEYRKYRKHVPLLPEWMWTCTPWYITNTGAVTTFAAWVRTVFCTTAVRITAVGLPRLVYSIRRILNCTVRCKWWKSKEKIINYEIIQK